MLTGLILGGYLLIQQPTPAAPAQAVIPPIVERDTVEPQAYRSGRGRYRAPAGGITGGDRGNPGPGYGTDRTGRSPGAVDRNRPAPPAGGRAGGFLGGLFAGTLLGSLLNPFGIGGYGSGFGALLGLVFWGIIIYLVFRVFRGWSRGHR